VKSVLSDECDNGFLLTGTGMTAVAEGTAGVAEGAGVGVGAGAKAAPPPLMMCTKL